MQLILFGVGLLVAVVIFHVFVVKKMPKEDSFKDVMDEIINESYDDEEESEKAKENSENEKNSKNNEKK